MTSCLIERVQSGAIPVSILHGLVELHRSCFPADVARDEQRAPLIQSWNNPPVMNYWILRDPTESKIIGYIRWVEHGGIRPNAILELEQIGMHRDFRGQNLASRLIDESIAEIASLLREQERTIKLVYLTTGSGNFAQKLYRKTLGAEIVATIPSFYEDSESNADEVIMLATLAKIETVRKSRGLSLFTDFGNASFWRDSPRKYLALPVKDVAAASAIDHMINDCNSHL